MDRLDLTHARDENRIMADEQLGFDLGERRDRKAQPFDPDEIRADLMVILADARGVTADALWDDHKLRYNRLVFPNMARWLPDDEAAQLCFEFAREIERIELLMAA